MADVAPGRLRFFTVRPSYRYSCNGRREGEKAVVAVAFALSLSLSPVGRRRRLPSFSEGWMVLRRASPRRLEELTILTNSQGRLL